MRHIVYHPVTLVQFTSISFNSVEISRSNVYKHELFVHDRSTKFISHYLYDYHSLDVLFPRNEIPLDELLIRSRHRYQGPNVLIAAIAHAKLILLKAQNMFWFESLNGHRLCLFLAFEIGRNCLNLLKRDRLDVVLFG